MSRFVAQIEGATAMSRTDINRVAQTILIPLLAEVYGYTELNNLDSPEYPNYPAIDTCRMSGGSFLHYWQWRKERLKKRMLKR